MVLAQLFTRDWMVELGQHVPVLLLRTVISFVTVLLVVRWTGKRTIANLAPFDLAMVIMIGEVAAIPVSDLKVDLLHGILPVFLIGGMHVLMTWLNMHSKRLEQFTEGIPTLLVKDGRVLKQNLLKERVSIADLQTALRHREITDISEVREAWIEHAGGISVIRKAEAEPVTPKEMEQVLQGSVERIIQEHTARLHLELAELLQDHHDPRPDHSRRPDTPLH